MEQNTQHPATGFFAKFGTLIKGFFIGFLVLLMLIPTIFIMNLITEREQRQKEVTDEISKKWATEQTIIGPTISIPYYTTTTATDGKVTTEKKNLVILPDQLNIDGKVMPEERHRSIYNVSVYRSHLVLEGSFSPATLSAINKKAENINWKEATIQLGIDDSRGLEDNPQLQYNGQQVSMEAAGVSPTYLKQTLSTPLAIDSTQPLAFKLTLKIKGTGQLYFAPTGNKTVVKLSSDKGTPSYDGNYLPDESTDTKTPGFTATWKILQANRGFAQFWSDDNAPDLYKAAFGVKLIQEADHYAKTERSVKYAILIISLTFLVFFFLEITRGRKIHPLQYILVGFALVIFYTLLLSISEYTGFDIAYLIAALATIGLIGSYIYGIFKKTGVAAVFAIVLGGLYGYIYFLIQLKDYALLFGSIGLFVILAGIMYYSRNINWHGEK